MAVTLTVFDKVHLVTLAFGATLLGLAADYLFHFLVKCHAGGNGPKAIKLLGKGLIICTVSSVFAYLFQWISPFPGLRQFAVFVAVGLMAACCSVFVLGQFYRARSLESFVSLLAVYPRFITPGYGAITRYPKLCVLAVLVVAIYAGAQVVKVGVSDDIRLLHSSSQMLLNSEKEVRDWLGGVDSQRYYLVTGNNIQQRLERMEDLSDVADVAMTSVANVVPSLAQQKQDFSLIKEKLFGESGALQTLCIKLGIDCEETVSQLPPFNENLVPGNLPQFFDRLWPVLALAEDKHAVVMIDGSSKHNPEFTATGLSGVRYVDQVDGLTSMLAQFRSSVSWLLFAFVVLLSAFFLLRFQRMGFAVILPLIFSCMVALAVSATEGVTLFHVLALLLVVGISVDTAVFYLEPGLSAETWLASTLACSTSLFGLWLAVIEPCPGFKSIRASRFFRVIMFMADYAFGILRTQKIYIACRRIRSYRWPTWKQ